MILRETEESVNRKDGYFFRDLGLKPFGTPPLSTQARVCLVVKCKADKSARVSATRRAGFITYGAERLGPGPVCFLLEYMHRRV